MDARSGEILALQDINHYVQRQVTGGVYPITSTEVCPTPLKCGTMQSGWPMPFANTGLAAPNDFTNSGGVYAYTPRFHDFPGFWLNTPGTYHWQAYRLACVRSDCRAEGPIVRFRVR